jgi:hypothetical protein
MMDQQLKAPFITQYSKVNWSTMVLAYADVIDVAEFLLGPAGPPDDTVAKATWNKKKK